MRVAGECGESYVVVEVRQEHVISPWFNILMDGCVREMKRKVVNIDAKLRLNGGVGSVVWPLCG